MIRDIVRATLVVLVVAIIRELPQREQPAPPPAYPPAWQPAYNPPQQVMTVPPERPLRRVAGAFVELAESVIGVVR
jgi:hypothetical protein